MFPLQLLWQSSKAVWERLVTVAKRSRTGDTNHNLSVLERPLIPLLADQTPYHPPCLSSLFQIV
ncbi:mCG1033006 [Mus musculus]|nr:mCG1033006 [Mus musculus]